LQCNTPMPWQFFAPLLGNPFPLFIIIFSLGCKHYFRFDV